MKAKKEMFLQERNDPLRRICPFLGRPVIKVLSGMRRVGKSCLLKLLRQNLLEGGVPEANICLVDMESLEFDAIRSGRDLHDFVLHAFKSCSGPRTLLVDEVQEITDWERAIASLNGRGDTDIVLTGSNAHLFGSEIATRLSGRYVDIPVFGLSFAEFMAFRGAKAESREVEFQHYLRYGGLPALHHMEFSDEVVFQYLQAIYTTILLKDIVSRHAIRQVPLLENIARFLFDNVGQTVSANRIATYLKSQRLRVGVDTVINYLGYFEDAQVMSRAARYDIKGRRLLEVQEKYYLGDIGFRHALLGYRETDIAPLLENVVYLELRRRGYAVSVGKWGEREIDFIATRGKTKRYIQVCYLLASPQTVDREFAPMRETPDNYPKLVLSLDTAFADEIDGVERRNLLDFLLNAND